ncbi:MAG: hypothetical protein WKF92_10570 [Pyrinomonadaceae bacterium]
MFEFDIILLPFAIELTLVVVDVLVAPVAELTVVLVVVVMVVLALALLFIAMFVFLVAFVATFVLAVSPQAIPNAPNAKRVESAITFLILN